MKIRHFITGLFILTCCFISSCKDDDYSPITLMYAVENGEMPIDQNNHLEITPFSKGESFLIRGGSGDYHITATNKEIVSFYYDGDTLTVFPVSPVPDTGEIIINDRSGNSYTLIVDINYKTQVFEVIGMDAEVQGGSLTQDEIAEIKQFIINDSQIKTNSKYILTYTENDQSSGEVIVTPQNIKGTFTKEEEWFEHSGNKSLTKFNMDLDDRLHEYELYITYNEDKTISSMALTEDLTAIYKGEYPNLLKAVCILKILPPVVENENGDTENQ